MKWVKSFLLHPWVNRFNMLYLLGGLAATVTLPVDGVGWAVLGGELAYLIARGFLDRGDLPAFQVRKMKPKDRERYFALVTTADRAVADLENNKHLAFAAMAASPDQIKRMVRTFLKLQLAALRIDQTVLANRIDFAAEIAEVRARLAASGENGKAHLQSNLDVLTKRQATFFEVVERRHTIETRLDTIENAVGLLSEIGLGVTDARETADQVQVILANVEDAELFMDELSEVIAPVKIDNAN